MLMPNQPANSRLISCQAQHITVSSHCIKHMWHHTLYYKKGKQMNHGSKQAFKQLYY